MSGRLRTLLSMIAVAASFAAGSVAFAQGRPPATTPGQPAATPAAQPAAGTPPAGSGEVRTSQSRVVDSTQEDLEREQGQTEQERDAARERQEDEERRRRDHKYQVGVRVAFALPYRFRLEYGGDDSAQCDETVGEDDDGTFCTGLGEPSLDLSLEFGITDTLELFFLMRIGLVSEDFTGASALNLGLGIRTYTNPTDMVKFYLGAAVMFDVGSTDEPASRVGDFGSFDFGVRGQFGLQVDVIRYLGIYLQVDPQIFFLRYMDTSIGGSIGLQGRFP